MECCEPVKHCLLYGTAIPYVALPADHLFSLSALNKSSSTDPFAEDSIYPSHDDVDNNSNPLASRQSTASATATATALAVQNDASNCSSALAAKAAALQQCSSKDLFVVQDAPTQLARVGVDLRLSTDWKGAYYSVMGVFGVSRPVSDEQAQQAPLVVNTETAVHRVPLVGAAFLLGVTAAFGGYAYYSTHRRR